MRGLIHRLKGIFLRGRWEGDVQEEIRFHLEMEARKLMRQGLSARDAQREARIRLGGEERVKERAREERGTALWDRTLRDLRFAFRILLRTPLFTGAALLTLALGIGGTVALFSVVHGVLLRPLPVAEEERLAVFWSPYNWRGAELDFVRDHVRVFEGVAGFSNDGVTLRGDAGSTLQVATVASANLFGVLGATPLLGQTFRPGDDRPGAEPVIVLSYGIWQAEFGGDPTIVGRRIEANGQPTTVLGVMPREFYFPGPEMTVFTPLDLDPASAQYQDNGWLVLLGRIRRDVGEGEVQADLRALADALGKRWEYPDAWDKTRNPSVTPLRSYLVGDVRPLLLLLLGAAGLTLVMACANVAGLLLSRAADRKGEMAIRAALGAGRGALGRQILTESLVLGHLAGVLGVGMAMALFDVLVASLPLAMDLGETLSLDWRALAAGLGLALASGSVIALAPMRTILRGGIPTATLGSRRQSGVPPGSGRLQRSLVSVEVLITVVLASGAALLVRTVDHLREVDIGLEPAGVFSLDVTLPSQSFGPAERAAYFEALVERAQALPGVLEAGLINRFPVRDGGWQGPVRAEDRPDLDGERRPNSYWRAVTPGTFAALGAEMVEGRGILGSDRAGSPPVAVVNETFARRMWGEESALGRRFSSGFLGSDRWVEVVGVVRDIAVADLIGEVPMAMYLPWDQALRDSGYALLVLKTELDPNTLLPPLRRLVREVDPRATVGRAETMVDALDQAMAEQLRLRFFLGLFSLLGITLGTIGVFGVVSYGVRRRRADYGIRMALGARPVRLLVEVVAAGMVPVAVGVGGGVAIFLLASSLLSRFLYQVRPGDPLSLAAAGGLLLLTGALASLLPALQAARTTPIAALRSE